MFGLGIKKTTDRRNLWRFFIQKPKEYLHRHTLSNGKQVKSLADWTMNRSHDSGTVKTGSRIINYENTLMIDSKMVLSGTVRPICKTGDNIPREYGIAHYDEKTQFRVARLDS